MVLATTIDAPGASRGLLSVLPQLSRKHTVVVSSVTDPTVLDATLSRTTRDEVTGTFETVDEAGQLVLRTPKGRVTIPAADVYF